MGLVLELYPDEPYNDFYIGDIRVELTEVHHEFKFKLVVHSPAMRTMHTITDQRSVELLPRVRVSAGTGADISRHGVKVVVEAPRAIQVDRGTLYRKKHEPPVS